LLLSGGKIQLAGEVKARGDRRRARSDWRAIERERGISVLSAVVSFEHEGLAFNLLDTPGHQDFRICLLTRFYRSSWRPPSRSAASASTTRDFRGLPKGSSPNCARRSR
jgi:Elongation factor Tu GTP binding domain